MSSSVLADSSWYIHEARNKRDPLIQLSLIAESRDIAVCGLVMAEVGRGIRQQRFLERYKRAWDHMLYVDANRRRWEETFRLAWHLDRKGQILPIQDIHIAVCAAHIGAVVLTVDAHFDEIPGIVATGRIV